MPMPWTSRACPSAGLPSSARSAEASVRGLLMTTRRSRPPAAPSRRAAHLGWLWARILTSVRGATPSTPSSLSQQGATFGRSNLRPKTLPPLADGSLLSPGFDRTLKPGTFKATFSSAPRQLGSEVDTTPVHAYATPSPMGRATFKATFGSESRFGSGSERASAPPAYHHTPSPMWKATFKATFGTASRFGSGSCGGARAPRGLPPRPRALPAAVPSEAEEQPLPLVKPQPLPKKLVELVVPTNAAAEAKELEPTMPLSARLLATPSPWRHALPLPERYAEVAGAA